MASFPEASCPHLSIPVEMDESMTSSSLDLAWPACEKCSTHVNNITTPNQPCGNFSTSFSKHDEPLLSSPREDEEDIEESLDPPLPLRSDVGEDLCQNIPPEPAQLAHYMRNQRFGCPWMPPPVHQNIHTPHTPEYQRYPQARPHRNPAVPMMTPQDTAPVRDVMTEASVFPSQPVRTGQTQFQELKRTITLPDECRTVFITYSVDTEKWIFKFVRFLLNHGFRPVLDIFDSAVQQMDVNKWMDSYLKNKSVLIIVVISPRYKLDVEGNGMDQHGLHTKYIYSQLQNEFIQQRCLNFRIVPVLFPNASQNHVPMWLLSTRVFRWPNDARDLLLRLLREERYIPPPVVQDLTLSIRPI
ncbi:E3 ubiquitin ligase TRAF3IP2 [Trichomycterus rosablanca]|uniref:E3 ubiquitin ligase TRAF3IP2 n=1 Tax=Trichomycterus rosablanca TaxID=2290929 RepID=UPI002F355ED0